MHFKYFPYNINLKKNIIHSVIYPLDIWLKNIDSSALNLVFEKISERNVHRHLWTVNANYS